MRVHIYPADESACGCYRLIWPGQVLAGLGADVHVMTDSSLPARWIDVGDDPRVVGCEPVDADVVVLQRCVRRDIADLIPHLQAQGIAVVVELDDDMHAIPKDNRAYSFVHPRTSPLSNYQHLERAVRAADLVTVSTQALARRYSRFNPNVVVVNNYVPQRYLDVRPMRTHQGVRVGWTGGIHTHSVDLTVAQGGIAKGVQTAGAVFHVVGDGVGVQQRLLLVEEPSVSGYVPLMDYPQEMAEIDVGVVPLVQNPFNQAKSYLKGLEFASLGVPFVATPTREYERLANMGAGDLANRPRLWQAKVHRLVTDVDYRTERSEQGRAVARTLTIEGNCERWLDAWKQARTNADVRLNKRFTVPVSKSATSPGRTL